MRDFKPKLIKVTNAVIRLLNKNPERGLIQHGLDRDTVRIVTFEDAPFPKNEDLTTQLGHIVLLVEHTGHVNCIFFELQIQTDC